MKIYYDKGNRRLVYIGEPATPEFWNSHWDAENFKEVVKRRRGYAISY